MTRTSTNVYDAQGILQQGFDYDRQAWVVDGAYVTCAHPADMACSCYGRLNEGRETWSLSNYAS